MCLAEHASVLEWVYLATSCTRCLFVVSRALIICIIRARSEHPNAVQHHTEMDSPTPATDKVVWLLPQKSGGMLQPIMSRYDSCPSVLRRQRVRFGDATECVIAVKCENVGTGSLEKQGTERKYKRGETGFLEKQGIGKGVKTRGETGKS